MAAFALKRCTCHSVELLFPARECYPPTGECIQVSGRGTNTALTTVCCPILAKVSPLPVGGEVGGPKFTLQGTNISPQNGILKMIFLFPRWDMLTPWRVTPLISEWKNEKKWLVFRGPCCGWDFGCWSGVVVHPPRKPSPGNFQLAGSYTKNPTGCLIGLLKMVLGKLWWFTNLEKTELTGLPLLSYLLGARVVWGRYNLTRWFIIIPMKLCRMSSPIYP